MARAVQVAPGAHRALRHYLLALQGAGKHEAVLTVTKPYLTKPGFQRWVPCIRAASLAKLGRESEAEQFFAKALESVDAAYVLTLVHQLRTAYGLQGAAEKFKAWLPTYGKNWQLHLVLGLLYSEMGKLQEAAGNLLTARKLAGSPLAKFLASRHLGATYYRMRKYAETEQCYLSCVKVRPTDIQVLNNLAYLYTNDLNQPRRALPYATEAAKRWSDNAKVLDTYGWTLAKLKRYAEAEQALVRAVQLERPLAVSRYHLGWVYEQIGRLDEALKQFRQAYEMVRTHTDDPLCGTLKKAIDRVRRRLESGSAK